MIKKVRIQNYQSLRDLTLDLGRFTVVTGESDLGKSAIIRAIKSVLINRTGQDFIRVGQKKAAVLLRMNDDLAVAWMKDGQTSTYRVAHNGQTQDFTKIGRSVPQEVSDALCLGEITIADERLNPNLHEQFDQPFLVISSPIIRAKLLGELSGVNILYLTLGEARRREQAAKRLQTTRLQDLEEAKERLQGYRYLASAKIKLEEAEAAFKSAVIVRTDLNAMTLDIGQLYQAEQRVEEYETKVQNSAETVKSLDNVVELAQVVQEIQRDIGSLESAQTTLQRREQETQIARGGLKAIIDQLASIEVCPTCLRKLKPGALAEQAHEHVMISRG